MPAAFEVDYGPAPPPGAEAGGASRGWLSVEGLVAGYRLVPAVFGVDLRVERGEIVALLGHNGAGKTVVLRAICGLLTPLAGRVAFDGRPIATVTENVRRGVSFIPSESGVFPDLTVEQNIAQAARVADRVYVLRWNGRSSTGTRPPARAVPDNPDLAVRGREVGGGSGRRRRRHPCTARQGHHRRPERRRRRRPDGRRGRTGGTGSGTRPSSRRRRRCG